ncbi:ABC transporter permease [Actinomadura sp. SCN-SB]|uniref:ABC transporter permease n=1 Tax=Actinomadura sp. SCN-SB TaxID=3373092 RepID=UPI00374FF2CE
MVRTALRDVIAHKARLLMTALAVLLGVAFVSGTLVFTDSVSTAYTRGSERSFDRVDVRIRPIGTGDSGGTGSLLDRRLLDRAGALPGVASATGTVSGFTALAGRDGRMLGDGWATMGANYSGQPLVEGRAPRAAGEIAIDAETAARSGYGVGDTVRLSVSGPVLDGRVTGVFSTTDGNVAAGGTLTVFDTATAQRLFAEPGRYNHIDLEAAPGTSQDALRRQVERLLPYGSEAVTRGELVRQQTARNAASFSSLSQILLACAGVALFVGGFLIVNTFTMLIARRGRELALLRAVGATRGQVTRSVLAEAAMVGLVASAVGLAIGAGVGAAVRALLSASGGLLPDGPLVISSATVLVSLGLGLGVTLAAAWLPARHVSAIPPVAALSGAYTPPAGRRLVVRDSIGAVLAATGGGMVVASTFADGGGTAALDEQEALLGLGAVLLLTGVFVLTPLISRPVIAAAGPALRRFGVVGRLAGRNAVRDPRRTAATASALTIGLTLITALSVLGTSADRTIRELAGADYIRADYVVTMANSGSLAPDAERRLNALEEVVASSPRRETPARVDGEDQAVTGFDTATIRQLVGFEFVEGTYAPGDTAVVDDVTAAERGWRVGDTLTVVWPDGRRGTLTVSGLYRSAFDRGVKVDTSVMDPHLDRIADNQIFLKTRGGTSDANRRAVERALGGSPAVRVSDKDDLVKQFTGAVGIVLSVLYGMLALAVLVAVLGVVNTMAMSVHERAREIGLLRAVGLDRQGVRLMIRLEATVIALFGGALGVALGVLLGWAAGELVSTTVLDTWSFVVPWGRLALVLVSAALVGVAAAVWPARRATRLGTLEAIGAG